MTHVTEDVFAKSKSMFRPKRLSKPGGEMDASNKNRLAGWGP